MNTISPTRHIGVDMGKYRLGCSCHESAKHLTVPNFAADMAWLEVEDNKTDLITHPAVAGFDHSQTPSLNRAAQAGHQHAH